MTNDSAAACWLAGRFTSSSCALTTRYKHKHSSQHRMYLRPSCAHSVFTLICILLAAAAGVYVKYACLVDVDVRRSD